MTFLSSLFHCCPCLALSAFYYFIVHIQSFIVHLLTSSLFQCFIELLLVIFSPIFFPNITCICLFFPFLSRSFLPSSPFFLSPQFILLWPLASWLQPCTSQPLSAWSGCLQQCGVNGVSVSYTDSDWMSSLHTKGQ